MIIDCCDNCEFCLKFKKPFLRSVFRFPVLDKFNEYISMDLKEVEKEKVWILHLIDAVKRYTAAYLLEERKKSSVSYISDMSGLFWSTW